MIWINGARQVTGLENDLNCPDIEVIQKFIFLFDVKNYRFSRNVDSVGPFKEYTCEFSTPK
jgi:hypothetical protein